MSGISGLFSPTGILDVRDAEQRVLQALEMLQPNAPAGGKQRWGTPHVVMAATPQIIGARDSSFRMLSSGDGSVAVAWDGEIYNAASLQAKLNDDDVRLKTNQPAELVVEGYRRWGLEGLLARLNGAFSCALYDRRNGQMYLVRDRSGNRPLFFSLQGGLLSFSSQLRAFRQLTSARWRLDASALATYLHLRFVPSPHTLVQGISRVPAAHYVAMGSNGIPFLRRYWHPWMDAGANASPAEMEATLEESVRRRWAADGRVCLISINEWESALMASCVQRTGTGNATVYLVSHDTPATNAPLRQALKKFGCHLEDVVVTPKTTLEWDPLESTCRHASLSIL